MEDCYNPEKKGIRNKDDSNIKFKTEIKIGKKTYCGQGLTYIKSKNKIEYTMVKRNNLKQEQNAKNICQNPNRKYNTQIQKNNNQNQNIEKPKTQVSKNVKNYQIHEIKNNPDSNKRNLNEKKYGLTDIRGDDKQKNNKSQNSQTKVKQNIKININTEEQQIEKYQPYSTIIRLKEPYQDISHNNLGKM